jgi:hypothetical protein
MAIETINLNENAQKLTGGELYSNITTEIPRYRWVENMIDYSELQVKLKGNAYQENIQEVTLSHVLGVISTQDQYEKCKSTWGLLYEFELYGNSDDYALIKFNKNQEQYKEKRRLICPIVEYVYNNPNEPINPLVVLDIDFKKHPGWISDTRIQSLKSKIYNFFNQESGAVFIYESVGGVGFHIGMSFYSNNICNKTYQQAYNIYVKRLVEYIDDEKFPLYIDYSVSNLSGNFYLGYSHRDNFKKPTVTLYIESDKMVIHRKRNNYLSANSFQDDFRLNHYMHWIDTTQTYFDRYDEWINMIYAVVCAFGQNYDKAYEWFDRLSSLSPKYYPEYDDKKFDAIFESEPEVAMGINYIIKSMFPEIRLTNYIGYSFDDVRDYYKDNKAYLKLENSEHTQYVNNWISELEGQFDIRENLIIESPPNSGKSTYFLGQENIIFLAPTVVVRDDLSSNHPYVSILKSGTDIELNRNCYLGIYDSIYSLLNSGLDLKKYTLVFDEKHEIFCSADVSFRHRVLYTIVQSLDRFKNVIFLTGTDLDFRFTNITFQKVTIQKRQPFTPALEFVSTDTPLDTMVAEILNSSGKQVCFINNKNLIEKIQNMLVEKGRRTIAITSETKYDLEQQEILSTNVIPKDTIILGTQMIIQGISLNDPDITFLRFYQPMLAEYVAQFSFRARNEITPPKIVMYVKSKGFRFQSRGELVNAYNSVEEEAYKAIFSIESFSREIESDYHRYYEQRKKEKKYLPVIQYRDGEPELDLLLMGYLATQLTSVNLASDLFGLMTQLLKWNFKFQFRHASMTELLRIHTRETKEKQVAIIKDRFLELVNTHNISQKQEILFRAKCALNWIETNYFFDMDKDERCKLFSDQEFYKRFVVLVGVIAREKNLTEVHLDYQIQKLGLKSIIGNISEIQNIPGFPIIAHPMLIQQLGLEDNSIKAVKKQLSWFWELTNNTVNSVRSFTVSRKGEPFEPYIDWGKFEDERNFGF